MIADKLSPLQLELLKVYSFQPSDQDLQAVKKLLADYFSNKLVNNVAKAVDEKGISQDDLDRWLNE
ncbi:hypothetical protein [Spirosoma radiotolerans]|uniref:Uncharacterized protein n=1 Tax=Spirosoma radiotolerans TaxID=1379870 RepID=A0A0E3ZSR0_9BACT|nr:hypothetical protein [Spirosoma radiotolerans]AKD54514.1 hypothetical protein SD10_05920 [Spirosoma radiotolerans]